MRNIITKAALAACMASLIVGCKTDGGEQQGQKSANTHVVVVGMENSRFAGSCPGAGLDAERMYGLLSRFTTNGVLFKDASATKANVAAALTKAVADAKDGLVIFCYSGHGGSEPFPDTGVEEVDGRDEFLCLYDTYMRDNEIWNIISKSAGRVMIIADCCHSETIMRNPGFKLSPPLSWDHTIDEKHPFSMLCWSGCPDDTYSYGSATGGQFTNAMLRHFDSRKTYETLWNDIKNDRTLRKYENPQSTVLGNGFAGKPAFR